METGNLDYRAILAREFGHRTRTNARYSLRAYARDLGLSPSRLSEIFSGKNHLSTTNSPLIAKRLGLDDHESQWFIDLVATRSARSKTERGLASTRVKTALENPEIQDLELSQFHYLSNWYSLAIVELLYTEDFKAEPAWIARRLGITDIQVQESLFHLKRLKIIKSTQDKLELIGEFRATPSGGPSKAIRRFHSQILEKAAKSIQSQAVTERDLSSIIMAIDQADLPVAAEMIKKFRRELNKKLGDSKKKKNEVYCLSVQFFKLTQEDRPL